MVNLQEILDYLRGMQKRKGQEYGLPQVPEKRADALATGEVVQQEKPEDAEIRKTEYTTPAEMEIAGRKYTLPTRTVNSSLEVKPPEKTGNVQFQPSQLPDETMWTPSVPEAVSGRYLGKPERGAIAQQQFQTEWGAALERKKAEEEKKRRQEQEDRLAQIKAGRQPIGSEESPALLRDKLTRNWFDSLSNDDRFASYSTEQKMAQAMYMADLAMGVKPKTAEPIPGASAGGGGGTPPQSPGAPQAPKPNPLDGAISALRPKPAVIPMRLTQQQARSNMFYEQAIQQGMSEEQARDAAFTMTGTSPTNAPVRRAR